MWRKFNSIFVTLISLLIFAMTICLSFKNKSNEKIIYYICLPTISGILFITIVIYFILRYIYGKKLIENNNDKSLGSGVGNENK